MTPMTHPPKKQPLMQTMRWLLAGNRRAFWGFARIAPLAAYSDGVPPAAWHVAKIVALRAEDCGPCTQLAPDMARAEGEDLVQDCWLRWREAAAQDIVQPRAWLSRVATHLCLDRLQSARARRGRRASTACRAS